MLSGMWRVVLSPRQKTAVGLEHLPHFIGRRNDDSWRWNHISSQSPIAYSEGLGFRLGLLCLPEATVFPLRKVSVFHRIRFTRQVRDHPGPDISSMSELGLWRQERSEAGVRSAENPAPGTWLKTKHQPSKGENGLAGDSWKDVYQDNPEEIKLNPVHSQGPWACTAVYCWSSEKPNRNLFFLFSW